MNSLGEMIGNIAHQWRQPLNTISAINIRVETLLLLGEKFTHEIYKPINEEIDTQLQYLSNTINTFMNYINDKKEYKESIIQDSITNTLNITNSMLKNNNIQLIKLVDYDKPIKRLMITGELEECLINIINNAKDILINKDIDDKWIKLTLTQKDDKVIITIEDNGGGISQDIIDKIFDPYFTTKHKSRGIGLGLYMSYKLIANSCKG
ncbi:MAG: HAMP domain-containing sensor histidine kinase, partial [Campylobacterota bacterium]|nr:HAMP domain-containing sensor histidine kinase [Campylobacterota bacterium]